MPANLDSTPTAVPAIAFDDLPPSVSTALSARVQRLGYLGEFFQRAAHQPEALLAFNAFTEAGKAALGERLTELVALTASVKMGNIYERNQHERLSVRRGLGRHWVAAVENLDPAAVEEVLGDQEREAQAVVLAVLDDHGRGSRALVESYAAHHGAAAAIALLLVVGRYLAHAAVVNALEIQPPVPSIFADGPPDA